MNPLTALIRDEIAHSGSIRFERFMELALYHSEWGYYRRDWDRERTGRQGDFFTSVSVGALFGRLLARQFLEMWEKLDRPEQFNLVEQGAEDGQLACDILDWCRSAAPEFFSAIKYVFVEEAVALRAAQQKKIEALGLFEKAGWVGFLQLASSKLESGVFFSNELVDAFPVRRILRSAGGWREMHVVVDERGEFAWVPKEIDEDKLSEAMENLPLSAATEGYTTEINLRARDWMEQVGMLFQRGYFLTIDYGFPAEIYYADFRRAGTLTGFREHRRTSDVLQDIGRQDITAQVDFTALARAGAKAGLERGGFLDQQHFLTGIAERELRGDPGPKVGVAENPRAWQTLTNPEFLGARFQVLLQGRGAPFDLAGLRFGRASGLG